MADNEMRIIDNPSSTKSGGSSSSGKKDSFSSGGADNTMRIIDNGPKGGPSGGRDDSPRTPSGPSKVVSNVITLDDLPPIISELTGKIVITKTDEKTNVEAVLEIISDVMGVDIATARSLLQKLPLVITENAGGRLDLYVSRLEKAGAYFEVDGVSHSPKPTTGGSSSGSDIKPSTTSSKDDTPKRDGSAPKDSGDSKPDGISAAEAKLNEMIGLDNVKREVQKIKAYVYKNEGKKINTHMFFVGNPGTGKTVVARLIGEILYNAGALPSNKFLECAANDLLSPYIGGTPQQTMDKVNAAMGGVLFIDEAYSLNPKDNSHGKECIDTLIKAMEDHRGEICCIFAGYPEDMDNLMGSNPGFESRIKFKIRFDDYSPEELDLIVSQFLEKERYTIDEDAKKQLLYIINAERYSKNFGNARKARTVAEALMMIQAVRTSNDKQDRNITMADIEKYAEDNNLTLITDDTVGGSEARAELDKLVGLDSVKETIDDLISYFSMNIGQKTDFHMAFLGNPGTGKTVVARIVGKLLNQEGLLPTDKFIEASSTDLIAMYVGHTAPKTRAICEKAMGGVLFIDEAYMLAGGLKSTEGGSDFGAEAIAELLKQMEDHRGDFCVILAGYTKEMKMLFNVNPGLESRVKFQIDFPDYNEEDLFKMSKMYLKKDKYEMDDELIKLVCALVYAGRKEKNYANARSLREAYSKIEIKQAGRVRKEGKKEDRILTLEDVKRVFAPDLVDSIKARLDGKEVMDAVSAGVKMVPLKILTNIYSGISDKSFREVQKDYEEAVVAIKTDTGESSGFIFTSDGFVGTCAHCVRGANEIKVRHRIVHRGKNIDTYYPATIVDIDEESDTAIIKMMCDETFVFMPLASEDVEDLAPLSEVYLMGYPFGFSRFDTMSINVGKIASYQRAMRGQPDQINLDISAKSGNSGSCVIDAATGKIIGVLCGSSTSRSGMLVEEINYCRPISYIWNLIKRKQ